MRLCDGEVAPIFQIKDMFDRSFDMQEKREKLLMLCFFRYASCPLCNLRVHELIVNQQKFKDKLEIVMVFQSPKEKIEQYVGKQDIPYKVIPDPARELYKLYKVEYSWVAFIRAWTLKIKNVFTALFQHGYLPGSVEGEIHRVPADFIIDTNGKIVKAFYGEDIGDHLPLDEIMKVVGSNETG